MTHAATFTLQAANKPVTEDTAYDDNEAKWRAVLSRDARADGSFYFSVLTTGVYCRPSCGARTPKRENVDFHTCPEAAEKAGFRPCKRCRPLESPAWAERQALIARACRFIEDAESTPVLADIAAHVGLSAYHFHRIFKEITGVTPKAYASSHRTKNVRGSLKESRTVTEAIYDAGYNANSRFYEKAQGFLGMTPKQYRAGGSGLVVRYSISPCSLGFMLMGATERGICTIQLGDNREALMDALKAEFPRATLEEATDDMNGWLKGALTLVDKGKQTLDTLPLDIRGTAFQEQVWQALRAIPEGETKTYSQVAEAIGKPKAVRAVANACANNRIAIAIPCHRVIRGDGSLSGYRWGVERKAKLLKREAGE
ncbi:bifunctional DNA-binding transcriptional regulator/O6-methylguanine-DNA methyltransferase Ada [Kordiimonas gwangyangensis]|uniref:bifunctional DNA-binding transcriptional regulator/O6-methylguanine-DNA methyltransferase Ada n=1 Tax=Kordiimonas gwangyangensis TaxID=288022 RepID=UPI000366D8F5|nr:bifunctional DNA-binding transcriptional regulator/O6-methylguanine-DNA methyltransferase Ada [Kordiimonas gwangyangensis]